jgi:hypothetical protein
MYSYLTNVSERFATSLQDGGMLHVPADLTTEKAASLLAIWRKVEAPPPKWGAFAAGAGRGSRQEQPGRV